MLLREATAPEKSAPIGRGASGTAGTALKPRRSLSALEQEFLPPLLEIQETPPSPRPRAVLWTLIGLVVAAIGWACIGTLSIVSTAPGKFIPDGRVKELQPLQTSIVKAVDVKDGQHVRQGDLLVELDPSIDAAQMQADADKYGINRLDQARLRAELTHRPADYGDSRNTTSQVALEEQTRQAQERAFAAKLDEAQAAVEEKLQAESAAEATLAKYQQTTAIAAEKEQSARPLVATGAISRVDYLQLKEDLVQNRNDLAAQQKTVLQAQAALTGAQGSLTDVERGRVSDLYDDLNKRVTDAPALKGDLDKSADLYKLNWLRAPVSGQVQRVDVTTIGQVVTAAQSLVTIVPDGTPLIVEASVSNQDIGYLQVGQSVDVKVDTFPFQKYGSLRGTLIWISPDAEDKNAASADLDTRTGSKEEQADRSAPTTPNSGYVYKVHIRTDSSHFVVDGQPRALQPGMTVQADIVTDHRRVIEFFLSPVLKYLDEGLRVR